jgi:hypothetical protein
MHKVLKLLLLALFYLVSSTIHGQNKYALLIGINDYYDKPGVKNSASLTGCVNDANAVKMLLLDRFALPQSNIHTLYNTDATKKNIMASLKMLLAQCKPGDALFFYFSGHGVWIDNKDMIDDPVKRGMNQAIVTSDLYAENWGCLVRDATLKKAFNQFVDKKVKVTTVFDCCYAGNLMMMIPQFGENIYEHPEPVRKGKFLSMRFLEFTPRIDTSKRCQLDTNGAIIDTADSDSDGVPDCADYEMNTSADCFPVTPEGIGSCTIDDMLFLPDNDSAESDADSSVTREKFKLRDTSSRAFSLTQTLSISDRGQVARPSERLNSGFLSISATSDREKGLEISDESGIKRGAFTKALLTVYKTNPAALPVAELLKKISAQMNQQKYKQTPTYHYDKGRLSSNLISTESTHFRKSITAKCSDVESGIIILDRGSDAGIAKGNVFTNSGIAGNIRIQVIQVDAMSAFATPIDIRIVGIKKGDEFTLTDGYTSSAPLIKLCIRGAKLNSAAFNKLFANKIKPFVRLANYRDYKFFTNEVPSQNIFFNESKPANPDIAQTILERIDTSLFYVFLPIPEFIAEACKQVFKTDQNIQMVSAVNQADFVLYLNYAKPRTNQKGEFIFSFCRPILKEVNNPGERTFYVYNVSIPSLDVKGEQLTKLVSKIHESARLVLRGQTTRWLNDYKKR